MSVAIRLYCAGAHITGLLINTAKQVTLISNHERQLSWLDTPCQAPVKTRLEELISNSAKINPTAKSGQPD